MNALTPIQMQIAELLASGNVPVIDFEEAVAKRFPTSTVGDLRVGIEAGLQILEERTAQYERETDALKDLRPLFDGMPEGTELGECARIKAKRGDPLALAFLKWEADQAGGVQ